MREEPLFDWESYVRKATFNEIRDNSPQLAKSRLPTMYSPDKKHLYLTSLDEQIDLVKINVDWIDRFLVRIAERFSISLENKDYRKVGESEADFYVLSLLVYNLELTGYPSGKYTEEYGDPKGLLEKLAKN